MQASKHAGPLLATKFKKMQENSSLSFISAHAHPLPNLPQKIASQPKSGN
jgi:hypothetical protein